MSNREIKFRAWDVERSEMVYHGAFQFEQFPKTAILSPQEIQQLVFPFEGIESGKMVVKSPLNGWHLMQYTGLKDRRGEEIYEGDILKVQTKMKEGYDYIGVVRYQLDSFKIDIEVFPFNKDLCMWNRESEIIGNIYEHSNLLNNISSQ